MDDKNFESAIFTLTDEDGNELDFEVIGQYEMNGTQYVAMLPVEEEEKDTNDEIWEYTILKLAQEDGEEVFVSIDDDDEFEAIADYFDDLFSQEIDYDN